MLEAEPQPFDPQRQIRWRAARHFDVRSPLGAVILVVSGASAACAAAFGLTTMLFALAAVAGAVITVREPRFGFVAAAALAPFDAYIPHLAIYKDLLWTDLLFFGLFAAAIRRRATLRVVGGEHALAVVLLIVLAASQTLSLTFIPHWADGSDNLLRFLCYATMVCIVPSLVDAATIRLAAAALVCGTVGRFAYEAVPYFTSSLFVLHPSYQFGVWTSNPNTIAGFGSAAIPLALDLANTSRGAVPRLGWLAAVSVVACGLVLSFSKGSWVATAAAIPIWMLFARSAFGPWRLAVVAGLIAIAIIAVPSTRRFPAMMVERWTSAASAISNVERMKYVRVAADLIMEHPVVGVGLKQFPDAYKRVTTGVGGPDDPHNTYLFIATELGLPALGAFLLFWATLIGAAVKGVRGLDIAAGLLAALIAIAVFQLFSSEPWNSRVFWVLASCPWPALRHGAWPGRSV